MLILLTAFLRVPLRSRFLEADHTTRGSLPFLFEFMQTGILGVFLATDLFLFYLFWEIQLIPMFFLIGMWGHEKRVYATIKFIIYTIVGSLLMLIALIGLYVIHGAQTGQYIFPSIN